MPPGASFSLFRSVLIESGPDDREWTIPSIAETLGLGPDAHHAIGVSVSRLARAQKIERARKGVYTKLPPKAGASAEGAGRVMNLEVGSQLGAG